MNAVTIIGVATVAVVSITSHEAAHGFMADRLGDSTARERGRLTLNPIPHIDLFFTILIPLFLILSNSGFIFGGAKPVPVDVSQLRHPRRDWALVGAAGPGINVVMALGLTAMLATLTFTGLSNSSSSLAEILAIGIFLNALLAIFNLIPIPPLDGSRVVQYYLSGTALTLYRELDRFGLVLIVALIAFVPQFYAPLGMAVFGLVSLITMPFGMNGVVESVLQRVLFS